MNFLTRVRVVISKVTFVSALVTLIATITIFALCRFGVFSNQDIEIADHLQDVLEMTVSWLLILSVVTFICSFLGGGKKMLFTFLMSGCCAPALAWLAFVNGMRRN